MDLVAAGPDRIRRGGRRMNCQYCGYRVKICRADLGLCERMPGYPDVEVKEE